MGITIQMKCQYLLSMKKKKKKQTKKTLKVSFAAVVIGALRIKASFFGWVGVVPHISTKASNKIHQNK